MTTQLVKKQFGGKRKGYQGEKWSTKGNRWFNPFRRGVGLDLMNRLNASGNIGLLGSMLWNMPLKDGGRVKGVGKATHGYGRAMRKRK